jgi:hypothetical protein
MVRLAFPALLLCVLAACVPVATEIGTERDTGGSFVAYEAQVARLAREGTPFVIPRYCASACTMYLSLPQACAHRDGVFGFHSARLRGPIEAPAVVDALNQRMASHYPERLRRWFLEEGPGRDRSSRIVRIPARDLIARGEVRACR